MTRFTFCRNSKDVEDGIIVGDEATGAEILVAVPGWSWQQLEDYCQVLVDVLDNAPEFGGPR